MVEKTHNPDSNYLETLVRISSSLSSSYDVQQVLDTAIDLVTNLLKAERGFIMLSENGTLVLKVSKATDRRLLGENLKISQTLVNEVFKTNTPILSSNAMDDARFDNKNSIRMYGLRSVLCVPLSVKGSPIGVLYLDNRLKADIFTERDLAIVSTFANQAAIAFENARLYESLKNSIEEKLRFQEEILREKSKAELERQMSRMREELAHYLVHDLRNPLMVVGTAFNLLKHHITEKEIDPDSRDLLSRASTNLRRLSDMLNDILDVYLLEEGRLPLKCTKLMLHHVVKTVLDSVQSTVAPGVRIIDASEPIEVNADESLLQRILHNLLQNSCRATREGFIKVVASRVGALPLAEIRVIDSGTGIPEECIEKLFSKFVRVETASGRGVSKGLGLAFCKLAVEAHGGTIRAQPNPDGGTIVSFTLPLSSP